MAGADITLFDLYLFRLASGTPEKSKEKSAFKSKPKAKIRDRAFLQLIKLKNTGKIVDNSIASVPNFSSQEKLKLSADQIEKEWIYEERQFSHEEKKVIQNYWPNYVFSDTTNQETQINNNNNSSNNSNHNDTQTSNNNNSSSNSNHNDTQTSNNNNSINNDNHIDTQTSNSSEISNKNDKNHHGTIETNNSNIEDINNPLSSTNKEDVEENHLTNPKGGFLSLDFLFKVVSTCVVLCFLLVGGVVIVNKIIASKAKKRLSR